MGAKLNYNAAVPYFDFNADVVSLSMAGFEGFWRRFGQPKVLSLHNFERYTTSDWQFSMERFLALSHFERNEMLLVFPECGQHHSLSLTLEGRYLIACAGVDMLRLSESARSSLFVDLIDSLTPFRPNFIAVGDELEVYEEEIERAGSYDEWHRKNSHRIEFYHSFT